jgi:hypothetical protein
MAILASTSGLLLKRVAYSLLGMRPQHSIAKPTDMRDLAYLPLLHNPFQHSALAEGRPPQSCCARDAVHR